MISVVITAYNYGKYISVAIESALSQTYTDIEVIVIDDGSTDNTPTVMEQYASDARIRYIRQANQGQPKAKNRGVAESAGEFVAFLDADDIWMPNKLARQLTLFSDPEVGVVYTRRLWMDQHGAIIPGNERTLRRGNILNHIFVDNFICFSSSIVRKHLLLDAGGFDENLPMGIDYDLWIRLAARCHFDFVDEPLVKYRTGHANLSKNITRRYECAQAIMNKALSDPLIREKFTWWVPRLAWADTWTNMGRYAFASGDRVQGIKYLVKAIAIYPLLFSTWKGLVKLIILSISPYKSR